MSPRKKGIHVVTGIFVRGLQERIAELEAQLAKANTEILRLSNLLWGAKCVFCGEIVGKDRQNQDIANEILREHIEHCPEHPLAKARAELARYKLKWQTATRALLDKSFERHFWMRCRLKDEVDWAKPQLYEARSIILYENLEIQIAGPIPEPEED